MFSLLETIDKYIKDNNIPFRKISINKCFFPDFINDAILREIRKTCHLSYTKVIDEYQFRYDKNNNFYLLVQNEKGRENFVIDTQKVKIKEDFYTSGRSEKHIIKMGCLFKLIDKDIKELDETIDEYYGGLTDREKARLKYEMINDMLEDKYNEFVAENKMILDEVNYEDELIHSTYQILAYIRYLYESYNEDNLGRSR